MKTNRFDETIRKKLEGIHSEFSERDWSSFSKHSKVRTGGRLWESSKFWYGTTAVSVCIALTGVCTMLYQQNQILKNELRALQEVIKMQSSVIRPDSPADKKAAVSAEVSVEKQSLISAMRAPDKIDDRAGDPVFSKAVERKSELAQSVFVRDSTQQLPLHNSIPALIEDKTVVQDRVVSGEVTDIYNELSSSAESREQFGIVVDSDTSAFSLITQEAVAGSKSSVKLSRASERSATKQSKHAQELITYPFRAGVSFSRTRTSTSYGVVGEIPLKNNFFLSVGLMKTQYNALYFTNEKVFTERTNHSFRKTFGNGIPFGGTVSNISTRSSLMQVPLAFGYRFSVGSGFSISGSIGTRINARFRQRLDCEFWDGHRPQKISGINYRKDSYPLVNNVSYSLGLEKSFKPVVVQGEIFYHHQDKDIPFQRPSTPGVRVKLLYDLVR